MAEFQEATFHGDAEFDEATFHAVFSFNRVHVLRLDDVLLNMYRVWPGPFTVRPDPADPTRGTLALRYPQVEEPEPAPPPSGPPPDN